MNDAHMAMLARKVADALSKWARTRDINDQKLVVQAQTELCAARREERKQRVEIEAAEAAQAEQQPEA